MGGMPKGVYPHLHIKPRDYPEKIISLVKHLYLDQGKTVKEVQESLPKGFKAQTIIERYIPQRRRAIKRNQRGYNNDSWVGSNATYAAAHLRVEVERGKAANHICVDCPAPASDWSYDHNAGHLEKWKTENTCPYSPDPKHYSPRCRKCHRAWDKKKRGDAQ